VWEWKVYSGRHPMSKRTWDTGVVKVIKRERSQTIALALGRKCRKHSSGRFIHPTAGCATRDKMVYWYRSSSIFGFQLFDHWSDIICFRVFNLLI
jgi:hypothetical protein